MDENSLKILLQTHVSGQGDDRLFTLAPGDLSSTAVDTLIQKFFPSQDAQAEPSIAISKAIGATVSDPLTVKGTIGSLFGVAGALDASATFRVENEEAELRLTVKLSDSWKFSTGFFAPIASGDEDGFLFDGLTVQNAQLIFDSKGDEAAGLSTGVNYRGTVLLKGPLETMGWLLGDAESVGIAGGIAFTDGHPEMDLKCQTGSVREVGQFRLGFGLHLTTKFLADEAVLDASFRLVTTLGVHLKGTATVLTLVGEFRRFADVLVFQASIKRGLGTALSDLAGLVNGADLTGALPDGFDFGNATSLSALRFVVDTNARQLTSVGLRLASTKSWRIIDRVAIDGIFLDLTVANPTDAKNRQTACSVGGAIHLGSQAVINVGAQFPDFDIYGSLANGPVNLTSAVGAILPGNFTLPAGLPDLPLSELRVAVQPLDRTLQLRAATGDTFNWAIVPDLIAVKDIEVDFQAAQTGSKTTFGGSLAGVITLGDPPTGLNLQVSATIEETLVIEAHYVPAEGDPAVSLVSLLKHFIPGAELPSGTGGSALTLRQLDLTAHPRFKTFTLSGQIDNVLSIPEVDFPVQSLGLELDYAPQRKLIFKLTGQLEIFGAQLSVSVEKADAGWNVEGRSGPITLAQIVHSNLVRDLAGRTTDIALHESVASLGLSRIAFGAETAPDKTTFHVEGALRHWTLSFDGGGSIAVDAALSILATKPKTGATTFEGTVTGTVSFDHFADAEFFQHISVTAKYGFGLTNAITFKLTLGKLVLNGSYTSGSTAILTFGFEGTSLTVGDLVTGMVNLIDPDVEDFQFDEPWDQLCSLPLGPLSFSLNLTTKAFSVTYSFTKDFGFAKITGFTLTYGKTAGATRSRLQIQLAGDILGQPIEPWDAMKEAPPKVAGQGSSKFDLKYLGLGQHVSFAPETLATFTNISSVMQALQDDLKPMPPALPPAPGGLPAPLALPGPLVFSSTSQWLIGAEFKVADTVALKIIFNDPVLYGIRVELSGEKAKKFAGLQFEILYRRISDTLGVYHTELTLPDYVRQLEFGAVSVTLPIIVLDIFTNGDFKIDVGFPWNGNFDRSFAVQVLPFTGAGGFYFNKLSAETATSVPVVPAAVGTFNPVIEFGIGVRMGLGKSFNKGPLRAELSITFQGVLEGVIAWFHSSAVGGPTGTYYLVHGSVSLAGRIYGAVDFEVIKIDVEVIARVTVQFRLEAYHPIVVELKAEVSVRASLTILFITVHFSFTLSVSQTFTIPALESGTPPWLIGGGGSHLPLPLRFKTHPVVHVVEPGPKDPARYEIVWKKLTLWSTKQDLGLFFQPVFSRDQAGTRGVALLFLENSIPPAAVGDSEHAVSAATTDTDFDVLAQALLAWAVYSFRMRDAVDGDDISRVADIRNFKVTSHDLHDLQDALAGKASTPKFSLETLRAFLEANFNIGIRTHAGTVASLTAFPMFPPFKLAAGTGTPAEFAAPARGLFVDYFFLIVRTAVQLAIDELADVVAAVAERAPLEQLAAKVLGANGTIAIAQGQDILPAEFDPAAAGPASSLTPAQWKIIFDHKPQTGSTLASLLTNLQAAIPAATGQSAPVLTTADVAVALFANPVLTITGTLDVKPLGYSPAIPETVSIPAPGKSLRAIMAGLQSDAEAAIGAETSAASFGYPLEEVLSRLNKGGALNHLAGIASRFLLHGVRQAAAAGTQALSLATGQEFGFPIADGVEDIQTGFTIDLLKPDVATFVTFPDSTGSTRLSYPLSAETVAGIARLKGDRFPSPPSRRRSADYGTEPRSFANSHYLPWDFPIVEMAQSLRAFLQEKAAVAASDLSLFVETRSAAGAAVRRTLTDFAWATKVNLTIHRIPGGDSADAGATGDTYVLVGAKAADNELLEDLWRHTQAQAPAVTPTLRLLFAADGNAGKLTAGPPSQFRLLKTNLATYGVRPVDLTDEARPTLTAENETGNRLYSATLSEPADFIRLVWESGTVGAGGYFLHCLPVAPATKPTPLPDGLFPDQRTGSLVLLIEGAATNAHSFHNCVIVRDTGVNLHEAPLMVQSTVTDRVFTGKTGHIGFSVLRDDASLPRGHLNSGAVLRDQPAAGGAAVAVPAATSFFIVTRRSADGLFLHLTDGESRKVRGWVEKASFTADLPGLGELANLYQILAYRITSPLGIQPPGDDLKDSANGAAWIYDPATGGMPVGPASNSPSVDLDEGRWTYERAIPVFRLFPAGGQVDLSGAAHRADLPAPGANPYAGVGNQVTLEFRWRDLYGHELPSSSSLDPIVRYFDPLIGIHLWPSTKVTYAFTAAANGDVKLSIDLSFDPSPFLPGETDATVRALDSYRTAFYQVHQSDVSFQVRSSQTAAARSLAGTEIRTYVRQAYLYLAALRKSQTVTELPKQTLTESFSAVELTAPAGLVAPVTVQIDINRGAELVDGDALAANPQVKKTSSSLEPAATRVVSTPVTQGQSLTQVATAATTLAGQVVTAATLVSENQAVTGLIANGQPLLSSSTNTSQLARRTSLTAGQWTKLVQAGLQAGANATFRSLASALSDALGSPRVQVTLDDLTEAIAGNTGLLVAGASLRNTVGDLAGFAKEFQKAFPGQFLAVAEERTRHASPAVAAGSSAGPGKSLFAVRLADTKTAPGIYYKIQDAVPLYFAPAPLANTLQSGSVSIDTYVPGTGITTGAATTKRFDSVDVNVLARDVLVAVEAFLDPSISVPAYAAAPDAVKSMLAHKEKLADAIYNDVTPIVVPPASAVPAATMAKRRTVAANLLRRQLLVNLVEGFDVETIVQSSVEVAVKPAGDVTFATAPRLVGQPVAMAILDTATDLALSAEKSKDLSFTISPAEAPLRAGESYLTFLFDTRTPEKCEGISLDLNFRVSQLEYDIVNVDAAGGIGEYQASSWLSFVLPIDGTGADAASASRHRIGKVPVVVPLRTYPVPPSLVSQRILADPDSLERVEDIREWDYEFTYAHPDVAQDAIDTSIRFNLPSTSENVAVPAGSQLTAPATLFAALLNFSQVYKVLWPDLQQQLKQGAKGVAKIGTDLAILVEKVAVEWEKRAHTASSAGSGQTTASATGELRYEVQEPTGSLLVVPKATGGAALPGPDVKVAGYELASVAADGTRTFTKLAGPPAGGTASIPDRTLTIAGFDIIERQNAWAAVWLTRNGQLLDGAAANALLKPRLTGWAIDDIFKFQTPPVRFNNRLMPLLVNDREWDIAALGAVSGTVIITPAARTAFTAGAALAFDPSLPVVTQRAVLVGQANIGVTRSATATGTLFIGRGSHFTVAGDAQVYQVEKLRPNPVPRKLDAHLAMLFATLLPASAGKPYEIQVACSYAFPLAQSDVAEPDLLATLPVLLSTRFAVAAGPADTQFRNGLVKNLVAGIDAFSTNHPLTANASYLFSVAIFASSGGGAELAPPLLRIERLRLRRADITL